MRMLIVEDERKVSNFLRQALEEEQYAVDQAFDGENGLDLAGTYNYDLIILDLMLPKMGGLNVIRDLRKKRCQIPILVLTARDAVRDKVMALDYGGDDYLTKPFSIEEFLARVRALLRRPPPEHAEVISVADLMLNPVKHEVYRGSRRIDLTNKEYALLEYFMRNPNRVLTRTMISEHVWNIDFDTETNVIDVYITYLRNKIDKGKPNKMIQTVRGVGYMLREDFNGHPDQTGHMV
ncbi:MAG: response regulator transcription factor [Nitrospirae bacterium]|nr:response regulator transcription factor [Nitrospirota bacterium]